MVRVGLTEKMICEKNLPEVRKQGTWVSEGSEVAVCLACSRNFKAASVPGGQGGAGQKGNRADCTGFVRAVKISGATLREGRKKEVINIYWAPHIYHLTGSSERSEGGILLSVFFIQGP